ncbi:hypothetical protein DFQ28_002174 [Apophysomyces sp. BC1034]|nr:hypothetical protein DFQ30_001864 [Apophysomyces sp. BC1015]KAG0180492.1 hypothetical protein DFQ29_000581 [Apophysomyces sp. BC1021]KAG0190359.1 hypothetical protein DFQ28_002174 [Apophysomyces sp. BC1034]
MGGVLSKSKKIDPNDYEKILSELDEKIQQAEIKLSEIKIRQRRTGVLWIIYSTIVWAIYLAYCFFTLHNPDHSNGTIVLTVLPVIFLPIGIYYTRKLLTWFYARKQTSEENNLVGLRKQQKLKVEELKKKTSYYTTQSLLERYDLGKKKQELANQQDMRKPVSMPVPRGGIPPPHFLHQQQQQQQQNNQQQQQQLRQIPPQHSSSHGQIPPVPRMMMPPKQPQWYDKIVDALVGDEGPETKYALICNHCFAHNGLALPQEIDMIQYVCPQCKKFNPSRKSRQLHPNGPVIPPQTPSPARSPRPASTPLSPPSPDSIVNNENGTRAALEALNEEIAAEEESGETIASRVRQRRAHEHRDE